MNRMKSVYRAMTAVPLKPSLENVPHLADDIPSRFVDIKHTAVAATGISPAQSKHM